MSATLSASGIELRLARMRVPQTDVYLMVPMDHGVSMGPAPGLVDLPATLEKVAAGGASTVVFHKGNARFVAPLAHRLAFCMHLSASTSSAPDTNDKVLVTTPQEAAILGADAVSTHTNFGATTEANQIRDLGQVARDAHAIGLPHLAMAYPRGPNVDDPYRADLVAAAARASAECGADLVKTVYTGDPDSFRDVVRGCSVPVLIAGGPRAESDAEVLAMIEGAAEAGAKGISMGRNIFQHEHPDRMVRAIRSIFVEGRSATDAAPLLQEAVTH